MFTTSILNRYENYEISMVEQILDQKEVLLSNQIYLVYLKEVPTSIAPGGKAIKTTIRAYIKRK